MKHLFGLLFSLLSMPTLAAFDINRDGLCFENGSPELRRFGPLGQLGAKKGVCQGMSGLVAAFYEHAKFVPGARKMSDAEAYYAVSELRRYHSGGCAIKKKVKISGYSNLQEFCRAHKDLMMSNAIDYNADIAVREISWNIDQFLSQQDTPISGTYERMKLHGSVESLKKRLNNGRWPLMLYYSHVVMVHSITNIWQNGRIIKVLFGLYDSNYKTSSSYEVSYSADGLPSSGQKMIWDTTPSRLTTVCW